MSKEKYVLITGSDGLVGSEAVKYYCKKNYKVVGIDNNSRMKFFGNEASTLPNRKFLIKNFKNYIHLDKDITNIVDIKDVFKQYGSKISLIIHAAAQPSHDWASTNPQLDFSINANGTLNLLECFREFCPEAVFIYTSTNKVYGDNPNKLEFVETKTRFDIKPGSLFENGINEKMSIDATLHSLFGVSKASADLMVQEYGNYFDLNTVSFRGGCLTGPGHAGTSLHGFLSYLAKCIVSEDQYLIFGYKGKQVRDNIHSLDLINAFDQFYKNPKKGIIYNIGGGKYSNCSLLEAISISEEIIGKKLDYKVIDEPRLGDHKWYISDLTKFKNDYPTWKILYDVPKIIEEIVRENSDKWTSES